MGSSRRVILPTKGLNLAPGSLARGEGVTTIADNVVLDAPGIYRKRQGSTRQANLLGGPIWKMHSDKLLNTNLLVNWGTVAGATSLSYGDGSAAWTAISGTYSNSPQSRMQTTVALNNHYITTDEGVRRIESDFTGWFAGMPFGLCLDLTGPAAVLVSGTMLADTHYVGYRYTLVRDDADGNEMESAPSARTVVQNNTGTSGYPTGAGNVANVVVRALLPKTLGTTATPLTTAYKVRVYRTQTAATYDAVGDEMQLVWEHTLTAGDITNGYVQFTDSTPDSFVTTQPHLYTNQLSGDVTASGNTGVAAVANNPPLRAYAIETFAGCVWLGNLNGYDKLAVNVLGVGATGLNVGDTITIGTTTFTGIAPGAPANNQFVVYTASASAEENVRRTVQNLVEAINKTTTVMNQPVYAWTAISADAWPGQFLLFSRLTNGAQFAVTATIAAGSAVTIPNINGVSVSSSQDYYPGGLMYSKTNVLGPQPDAFPPLNLLLIPRNDAKVLRLLALRNQLFVFTDVGVYMLTGNSAADFNLELFEPGFRLLAPDLAVICDDNIYAWGREGIAKINSSGTTFISAGIEPLLWQLVTPSNLAWVQQTAFATAYRNYHKVIFHLPTSTGSGAGDGYNCARAFVYDTRVEGWTRWLWPNDTGYPGRAGHGKSCAVVRYVDDLLFTSNWNAAGSDTYVYKELRTYAAADYSDMLQGGTTTAIPMSIRWNPVAPQPDMQVQWDQFHIFYEVSEIFSAWTTPTSVNCTLLNDFSSGNAVVLQPSTGLRLSRGDVPLQARLGTRLILQVDHQVLNEFCGIEGVGMLYTLDGDGTVRS